MSIEKWPDDVPWSREAEARWRTEHLRNSSEPRWQRVREELIKRGIRPEDAALATVGPDERTQEIGYLVTRDERFFEFTLDFEPDDPEEKLDPSLGRIVDWSERPLADLSDLTGDYARAAMRVLKQEGPEG